MARNLNFYGTTYNREEQLHFMYSSKTRYLSEIATNLLFSLPFTTWRINQMQVIISQNEIATLNIDYKKILYIADIDSDKQEEARFFHVVRSYDETNKIIFEIEIDKWATSIANAKISNCHISRCNRAIGESGRYDEVKKTSGITEIIRFKPLNYALKDCAAVFLLNYNVSQNIFGGNPISQTSLFGLTLQEIYDSVHNFSGDNFSGAIFDEMDIIEKTIQFIGSIHSMGGTIGTAGAQLNAHVLRLWIVPIDAVKFSNVGLKQIVLRGLLTNGADEAINNVPMIQNAHNVMNFNLWNSLYAGSSELYLPQYHVEAGSNYRGVPITRSIDTENTNIYYHFVFCNSNVEIYVEEGLQQEDITRAFEVEMTTTNATETSAIAAVRTLTTLTNSITNIAKGFAKGGYIGAAGAAIGNLSNFKDTQPLKSIGSGDGAVNFSANNWKFVFNPFAISVTRSIINEEENAYMHGAVFDEFNSDFLAMQQKSHLGNSDNERTGTFILIDKLNINGVDVETENFIRSEFGRGIWYEYLT